MSRLVKLFDEKQLLVSLQADALILIRDCNSIEPIKKFVECYDILKLTWTIQEKFPREHPNAPECDEPALMHLKRITQELFVFHGQEVPRPGFDSFDLQIRRLLMVFRVPREAFRYARLESGGEIPEETSANLPPLFGLDVVPRKP
jgi:hypothetical protein